MSRDKAVIDQAIAEVRIGFPFPEIIRETEDTISRLAALLFELVPQGGRLLDLGCGALDKATVYQKIGYQCFACDDFLDPWHSRRENLGPVLTFPQALGVQVYAQQREVRKSLSSALAWRTWVLMATQNQALGAYAFPSRLSTRQAQYSPDELYSKSKRNRDDR